MRDIERSITALLVDSLHWDGDDAYLILETSNFNPIWRLQSTVLNNGHSSSSCLLGWEEMIMLFHVQGFSLTTMYNMQRPGPTFGAKAPRRHRWSAARKKPKKAIVELINSLERGEKNETYIPLLKTSVNFDSDCMHQISRRCFDQFDPVARHQLTEIHFYVLGLIASGLLEKIVHRLGLVQDLLASPAARIVIPVLTTVIGTILLNSSGVTNQTSVIARNYIVALTTYALYPFLLSFLIRCLLQLARMKVRHHFRLVHENQSTHHAL